MVLVKHKPSFGEYFKSFDLWRKTESKASCFGSVCFKATLWNNQRETNGEIVCFIHLCGLSHVGIHWRPSQLPHRRPPKKLIPVPLFVGPAARLQQKGINSVLNPVVKTPVWFIEIVWKSYTKPRNPNTTDRKFRKPVLQSALCILCL